METANLLLASACSGMFSRLFVHPADTIRAKIMTSSSQAATIRSVLVATWRSEGFHGFYRGFGVTMLMQGPAVATYLTTYEKAKGEIVRRTDLHTGSPMVHLLAGITAETLSCIFWVPMEVLKQRMQVGQGSSTVSIMSNIIKEQGPLGLYRGYWLTIGVFGPYAMFYWMTYERLKENMRQFRQRATLGSGEILASAAISAGLGAALTTPLDVVKTQLQTGTADHGNLFAALGSIVRTQGLRGLFRGLTARVLWVAPQTSLTMASFERIKRFLVGESG
mmetsp:Transcript_9258/g.18860  ORF Transcript_9258/g.18860 Transcript_9258/m.18860 type:complete len:278 (+) Transcript_9258:1220-2053(+)